MVGVIGPDGVGKSTLLGLIAGVKKIQQGEVVVFDKNIAEQSTCARFAAASPICRRASDAISIRRSACSRTSISSAVCSASGAGARASITELLTATAMEKFEARPAGKLSGGMKQKLSLCCALINDPDLLILDEPTTGVDPLSRGQFWDLINSIRARRPQMSVIVATAYMDEAERFDWLMAMDDGKIIATGTLKELLDKTGEPNLDEAFIALMPEAKRALHQEGRRAAARRLARRDAGDRGRGADAPVRRLRRRRSRQLQDRAAARSSASSARTAAANRRR